MTALLISPYQSPLDCLALLSQTNEPVLFLKLIDKVHSDSDVLFIGEINVLIKSLRKNIYNFYFFICLKKCFIGTTLFLMMIFDNTKPV